MKLKKLKTGDKVKKQSKKQEQKVQVQEKTNLEDEEEQRDDALIDIKEELVKKQEPKQKINKRIQTNKLEQREIDTSKLVPEVKEQKKMTTWVTSTEDALKKDFKLNDVDHEFESLTDTKLNEELKEKKQKKLEEQVVVVQGGMKFAPLEGASNPLENKVTEKITFGKPKTQTQPIGISISTAPVLNFTNSSTNQSVTIAPLEKSPQQLKEEELQRKMKQRQQQRAKIQTTTSDPVQKGKGSWFKKSQPTKQQPTIQFKPSNLNFTNSNTNTDFVFKPLQKTKQQQLMQKNERKEQQFKFTNKKQQQERRKKREQEQLKKQLQGKTAQNAV